MNNEPLVVECRYNATINKVWKALTDVSQMKEWYFDIAEFKPEPGFEFSFAAGESEDKMYVHLCKIAEVVPFKKLSYTWKYKDYEGSSLLTFELFDEGDNTLLSVTHSGLETFPQNLPDFAKESFKKGWTYITETSLKNYLNKAEV